MINQTVERPSPDLIDGFRALFKFDSVTCALSDTMGRFNAMTSDMRPLFEGIRIAGPAITVKTLASDLAAAFKAIDIAMPGDVIVIDSHGARDTAFWGENMTLSAINRGLLGTVIDGACRDVEEIRRLRFPVVCKGIVPNVGAISGYGHVNVPVQCAGAVVYPGDMIVIDGNGVVVVPRSAAAAILASTRQLLESEHLIQERIKAGATIGELINVDEVFSSAFSYQSRALKEP